jgi:hypothetical protein
MHPFLGTATASFVGGALLLILLLVVPSLLPTLPNVRVRAWYTA